LDAAFEKRDAVIVGTTLAGRMMGFVLSMSSEAPLERHAIMLDRRSD
jgi:hypothetical protein